VIDAKGEALVFVAPQRLSRARIVAIADVVMRGASNHKTSAVFRHRARRRSRHAGPCRSFGSAALGARGRPLQGDVPLRQKRERRRDARPSRPTTGEQR